jgi:ABC-type polysaccharide/polyol phosphate export permease
MKKETKWTIVFAMSAFFIIVSLFMTNFDAINSIFALFLISVSSFGLGYSLAVIEAEQEKKRGFKDER